MQLGYSPATIERHAVDSATAYARYVAAAHDAQSAEAPARSI